MKSITLFENETTSGDKTSGQFIGRGEPVGIRVLGAYDGASILAKINSSIGTVKVLLADLDDNNNAATLDLLKGETAYLSISGAGASTNLSAVAII